ncbi:MAG: hypothetical protein HY893_03000 [Deltaproteobacteria bacterium]|nr:hypothetical protein [Deltaproteobacteria bacterium]
MPVNSNFKKQYVFCSIAIDVEHSCCHKNMKEPNHSPEMLECIDDIKTTINELVFCCYYGPEPGSEKRPYLRSDFDEEWKTKMKDAGWENLNPADFRIPETGGINPDALLKRNDLVAVIEIEKTKQETIWFDFMKIFAAIKHKKADFGVVIVPKNNVHDKDHFKEARKYLWYLSEFAGVEQNLLSRVAIIGYTQTALIEESPEKKNLKQYLHSKKFIKFVKDQFALLRRFNSEVQHLGEQEGRCYPKWLCQKENMYTCLCLKET